MKKLINDERDSIQMQNLRIKRQTCKTLFSLGTAALALTLVVILMYVFELN